MLKLFKQQQRGFTLIEILIVIGIIAILAAIVIVAINPAKQFAQARNTQREAGVNSILNAIGQRMADNKGVFNGTFGAGAYTCDVLPAASATTTILNAGVAASGQISLACLTPTYIAALPVDPAYVSGADTKYTLAMLPNGRVKVCAPESALENALPDPILICVTR